MQGVGLLYEQSAYLRVRAAEILFAAADQPTPQESLDGVRAAREVAYRSVQAEPANATAWVVVSWAEMVLGNGEEAVLALQRSWSLAPNSLMLTYDRLLLTDALGLAVVDDVAPSVRASVRRDATNLRNADIRLFNAVKEAAPEVFSLVDDEEQPA
jgi:cytochrome c-type biogenesis protein CcmH/NrfG